MNDDFDAGHFFLGFIVAWAMALILLGIVLSSVDSRWERETIKRGYAEYTVDVETKEVNFVWKERGIKN